MTETHVPRTVEQFVDLAGIRARYDLPGPHSTVVLFVPTPNAHGDALTVRWHGLRAELRRQGASDESIARIDEALMRIDRTGHSVLITSDGHSAAYCRLSTADATRGATVGSSPALIPAIAQVRTRPPVVGAIIDRVGAAIFVVHHDAVTATSVIEGEEEFIHRSAKGGWSQPRYQRRAEQVWERNAALVAAEVARTAGSHGTELAVLTGDERAVTFALRDLADRHHLTAVHVQAGGRHEPRSAERLAEAARDVALDAADRKVEHAVEELREELGQRDQAVQGAVAVREALAEDRVGTLFLDPDAIEPFPSRGAEADAHRALALGADVVVRKELQVTDGRAALLRYAYREGGG